MRRGVLFCFLGILLISYAGAAKKIYAAYYDISGPQDVEVTVMNLGTESASYVLNIYDARGERIFSVVERLPAGGASFCRLSDEIEKDVEHWGLLTVETADGNFLSLGLEYYTDGTLISVDNIFEPVPRIQLRRVYWYCIYYVNVGVANTGLVLMNPWWGNTTVRIYVRKQNGELLYTKEIELSSHDAYFLNLEECIDHAGTFWGVIDVKAENPIALACEYYDRMGSELEIDNVVDYYAVQLD